MEQEGLSKYLPMDYIKDNVNNVRAWIEFIVPEDRSQTKFGCSQCRKYFLKAGISQKYKNKLVEGRVIKQGSKGENSAFISTRNYPLINKLKAFKKRMRKKE